MIYYDIDITEDGYTNLSGEATSFSEMKKIICNENGIHDCVGSISSDCLAISIAAVKNIGVYLGVTYNSDEYLSLHNRNMLTEVVDVWGDDLNVSQGLFLPEELALTGIEELLASGKLTEKIEWITPDEIPESGNYIII